MLKYVIPLAITYRITTFATEIQSNGAEDNLNLLYNYGRRKRVHYLQHRNRRR